MSNTIAEIAEFGFIRTAANDDLIIAKPVEVTDVVAVRGDADIGGYAAITGDVIAGGGITMHTGISNYIEKSAVYISVYIADLNAASTVATIPMPFDCWIQRAWVVIWADVGASGGSVEIQTAVGTILTVVIGNDELEGGTYNAINKDPAFGHAEAGNRVSVAVTDATTNAVAATAVIALYRAWE